MEPSGLGPVPAGVPPRELRTLPLGESPIIGAILVGPRRGVTAWRAVPPPSAVPSAPTLFCLCRTRDFLRALGLTFALVLAALGSTISWSAIPEGFLGFLNLFLPFVALRSRRRPWGRVVEDGTGLPIADAIVSVRNASGRPVETMRTRVDGTFNTLLPAGTYTFAIMRPGYAFTATPTGVLFFPGEHLYRGGPFVVGGETIIQQLVIALQRSDEIVRRSFQTRLRRGLERLRIFQARWGLPLVLLGAAVNTLALWLSPRPLYLVYEILYAFFLLAEFLLARSYQRLLGRVTDRMWHSAVPLALVRLLVARTKAVAATKVSTPRGQFLLLARPGTYTLHAAHGAYYPYASDVLRVWRLSSGALPADITLHPRAADRAKPAGAYAGVPAPPLR